MIYLPSFTQAVYYKNQQTHVGKYILQPFVPGSIRRQGFPFAKTPMPRHLRGHLPRKHHRRWPPGKVFYLLDVWENCMEMMGKLRDPMGLLDTYLDDWLKLYGRLVRKYTHTWMV